MPFSGIVGPEQLAFLTKVLDDHCLEHGISTRPEREDAARRLVTLFNSGAHSADELKAGLDGV